MGREKGGGAQISGIRIFTQADAGGERISGFPIFAQADAGESYQIPQFGVFGKDHMGLPDLGDPHFR